MTKKLAIGIAGALVIFFLFNSVIMPWYVKHTDTAKVPNTVGLNFIEAKKVLEDAGFEIKQGDVKYDESKPIGQVLEQNPPGDAVVKLGRRIYLIVCGGEQLIEVPKLTGRSLRDARFTLEQRGLEVGQVVRKFSNELPEDGVVSQIIQPGSKVKRTTKIDLILSNGPELGPIRIPDLIGKKLEEAKKLIESGKLKVGKITYQASKDVPPGQVLDQYPKKEKSATENTPVDLFISKKPVVPVEPLEEFPSEEEDQAPDNKNEPGNENEEKNNNNEDPVKEKKPKEKEESTTPGKDNTKKKIIPKKKEDVKTDKDKEKNSGF